MDASDLVIPGLTTVRRTVKPAVGPNVFQLLLNGDPNRIAIYLSAIGNNPVYVDTEPFTTQTGGFLINQSLPLLLRYCDVGDLVFLPIYGSSGLGGTALYIYEIVQLPGSF